METGKANYIILGYVTKSLGEYQRGKENWKKVLAVAIEIGNREMKTALYGSLGHVSKSLKEIHAGD